MLQAVREEKENYLEHFARLEQEWGQKSPSWLRGMRKASFSRFMEAGFPTTRDENWKYTNTAPIARTPFVPAQPDPDLSSATIEALEFTQMDCPRLVFVNGIYSAQHSRLQGLAKAVSVQPLSEVLKSRPKLLEEHLGRYLGERLEAFTDLNTAFFSEGAVIEVEAGQVIENPIHVLYVTTGNAENGFQSPRNLFLVGRDSQVRIIESYQATEPCVYFTNAVTEAVLGPNAIVEHFKVESESKSAFHVARIAAYQARDSNFINHNITLGGALVRTDLATVMDGEGTTSTLNGLYLADGRQHVDNFTTMDHAKPHSSTHELYKGVLSGKSRGVFHGRIIVRQDAQKIDSKQTNDNLLLSDEALVNTKPQLEIYADDVKCTHGATIGQLEDEQLFYLRSRGIEKEAARGLLIYAFASDVIGRVGYEPLKARLHSHLANWLPNGHLVREAE